MSVHKASPGRNLPLFAVLALCGALIFQSAPAQAVLPELPRVFLDTTYSPPAGNTITVNAGGNLQAAINNAVPGDTIVLQAGATFTGTFTLPNKGTSTQWIYIRSSAYANLPSPGNRVSPASVAAMATLAGTGSPVAALQTAPGAHHFRFVGIEFKPSAGLFSTGVVRLGNGETSLAQLPHDIVIDRCYIHGDPTLGARRGVAINSASTAVIDSYLSDFMEVGADSQAIAGWNTPGPVKIVNNHLEAAGENVMFGGADPTIANLVPSDMEIRGNHFFKPLALRTQGFVVKNLFELKNAARVLAEGNIFENDWAAAQDFAINIKSANAEGTAPWSLTRDLTFRLNIVRHGPAAIKFCARDCDDGFFTGVGTAYLIQNNLFHDVSASAWGGTGNFFQTAKPITDLVINHNTVIHDGNTFSGGDGGEGANTGFQFTNNIVQRGPYGFKGSGAGDGLGTLATFFPGYVFARNAIAGAAAGSYPANNFFPAAFGNVGFVDFANGIYRLAASSPYRNAATDGKDLGADMDLLTAATACTLNGQCGSVTTPPPPPPDTTPPIISAVGASALTASQAAIGWATNEAADTQLEYGLTIAYGTATALNAAAVTTHSQGVSGLSASTVYHYRVKSRDAAGNLATSGDFTLTTLVAADTTAPTISGAGAHNITTSQAVVIWTTDEAADTQLEYGLTTAYGSSTALDTARVTSHSQGVGGLMASTVYHYRVKSRDAAGNLATSADFTFTTLAAADTAAPILSWIGASNVTASQAVIGWTTNEAADTQLEYGLTSAYGSSTVLDTARVTSHSQSVSGLGASTVYHYRVKSRDAAGNLATSGDFTFTTPARADTTAPNISGVGAHNITASQTVIVWTTNEAADTQLEYGLTTAYGSATALDTARVTTHFRSVSGLSASTVYHYRVKSRDAAGNLATSGDFTLTTLAGGSTSLARPNTLSGSAPTMRSASGAWISARTN